MTVTMPDPTPAVGALLAAVKSGPAELPGRDALYRDGSSRATILSAFPASYWQHHTTLTSVELRVVTRGTGTITLYGSDAAGTARVLGATSVSGAAASVITTGLGAYPDGGWIWFDTDSVDPRFAVEDAGWWAPADQPRRRVIHAAVGITTLHREQYLLPLLDQLAGSEALAEIVQRVVVIDHGSRRVADAEGFDDVARRLGERLILREQDNLGGSGGFARCMIEALDSGADAVILLDDDVEVDPESIRRLIRFAEYATDPTIVGGQMFDMNRKTRLHAYSEGIRWKKFFWETNGPARHDFATSSLRSTPWLHRRADADYNGWWMCLIPRSVLESEGLAMPYFIKWDDAEYGIRAGVHGTSTVTLPGAAVWHVSWDEKDDTIDWQGYFHARNRLITALLHSPHRRGGTVVRANFELTIKYLFALEYGATRLRLAAFRDVLAGPAGLHADLRTKIGEARSILAATPTIEIADAPRWRELTDGIPQSHLRAAAHEQPGASRFAWAVARLALRNATRPRGTARPSAWMTAVDGRWWNVGGYDSILIAHADGKGGRWLRRDRTEYRRLLRETRRLTKELRRAWPSLAAAYRAAQPDLVAPDTWRSTTSISPRPAD